MAIIEQLENKYKKNDQTGDDSDDKEEFTHELNTYQKVTILKDAKGVKIDLRNQWQGNPTSKGIRLTEENFYDLIKLVPKI